MRRPPCSADRLNRFLEEGRGVRGLLVLPAGNERRCGKLRETREFGDACQFAKRAPCQGAQHEQIRLSRTGPVDGAGMLVDFCRSTMSSPPSRLGPTNRRANSSNIATAGWG